MPLPSWPGCHGLTGLAWPHTVRMSRRSPYSSLFLFRSLSLPTHTHASTVKKASFGLSPEEAPLLSLSPSFSFFPSPNDQWLTRKPWPLSSRGSKQAALSNPGNDNVDGSGVTGCVPGSVWVHGRLPPRAGAKWGGTRVRAPISLSLAPSLARAGSEQRRSAARNAGGREEGRAIAAFAAAFLLPSFPSALRRASRRLKSHADPKIGVADAERRRDRNLQPQGSRDREGERSFLRTHALKRTLPRKRNETSALHGCPVSGEVADRVSLLHPHLSPP